MSILDYLLVIQLVYWSVFLQGLLAEKLCFTYGKPILYIQNFQVDIWGILNWTELKEYIIINAGLEEAQAGIKIAGRNINNLRYADDTTLMEESEEELKSFLMKVKEESEKVGLKLSIQKMKIMAPGPITLWEIEGERVETVSDFILGGFNIAADGDCSHEIKRRYSLEEKLWLT